MSIVVGACSDGYVVGVHCEGSSVPVFFLGCFFFGCWYLGCACFLWVWRVDVMCRRLRVRVYVLGVEYVFFRVFVPDVVLRGHVGVRLV